MEENMCVSFAVMQKKKKKLITLYVVQMQPVVPDPIIHSQWSTVPVAIFFG